VCLGPGLTRMNFFLSDSDELCGKRKFLTAPLVTAGFAKPVEPVSGSAGPSQNR
jgi:hypothetical protein